jgi:hypothetical protein
MGPYNGFTGKERDANGAALLKAIIAGKVAAPSGPCAMCGAMEGKFDYHAEDYSKPYSWLPPAAYPMCTGCHRQKLHKRFASPEKWEAFKAHVRRGGYASELKVKEIAHEIDQYVAAQRAGIAFPLRSLRPYPHVVGTEWWAQLSTSQSA